MNADGRIWDMCCCLPNKVKTIVNMGYVGFGVRRIQMCLTLAVISGTWYIIIVGWDNAVGVVTRYGLDGPWIQYWWGGARFSTPVQTGPETHPASYIMGTGSLSRW
jgi:hypothetical protein